MVIDDIAFLANHFNPVGIVFSLLLPFFVCHIFHSLQEYYNNNAGIVNDFVFKQTKSRSLIFGFDKNTGTGSFLGKSFDNIGIVDSGANTAKESFGLGGNSFDSITKNIKSGQGLEYSLFGDSNKLSKNDLSKYF